MQLAKATSSFDYAVFTFADDSGIVTIPVGVALWSPDSQWVGLRFVKESEKLPRFSADHFPYISLVEAKIHQWIDTRKLPFSDAELEPSCTDWWNHARELFIHRVRLSEPRPIDCREPEQELETLFEAVVSPQRAAKEDRTRVDGEITKCLDDLARKFKPKQFLRGFGGRDVQVLRSFVGPSGTVVIEGVNLASSQAEQQSDAIVSKLLRVREGTSSSLMFLVGYLTSPGGLNGERALVEWIRHQTGAKAFDLLRERDRFHNIAGDLVAQAAFPRGQ